MWMIGSVSAAYQSAVRGDRLRLMQSITVDYIECLAVGSLRCAVKPPCASTGGQSVRARQQQQPERQRLSTLNWIARDAISAAM